MTAAEFVRHFAAEPRIAKRVGDIDFTESGCWIWPTSNNHYAQCWMGDRIGRVHRISLEIKVGAPLGELLTRHDCDTPPCVNPAHLQPGTMADNSRDMVERQRYLTIKKARGIRNIKATLTDAEVVDALTLLADGASLSEVGRRYGVTHSTVACWRDGTFRHEARDAWLASLGQAS